MRPTERKSRLRLRRQALREITSLLETTDNDAVDFDGSVNLQAARMKFLPDSPATIDGEAVRETVVSGAGVVTYTTSSGKSITA